MSELQVGHYNSNTEKGHVVINDTARIIQLEKELKALKECYINLFNAFNEFMEQYCVDKSQYNKNFIQLDSRQ